MISAFRLKIQFICNPEVGGPYWRGGGEALIKEIEKIYKFRWSFSAILCIIIFYILIIHYILAVCHASWTWPRCAMRSVAWVMIR